MMLLHKSCPPPRFAASEGDNKKQNQDLLNLINNLGSDHLQVNFLKLPGNQIKLRLSRSRPPRVDRRRQHLRQDIEYKALLDLHAAAAVQRARSSSPVRPGWGELPKMRRWSHRAKNRLALRAAALDDLYSPSSTNKTCLYFVGTLPGSTPASIEALAKWSGWVVNTLTQWLRDHGLEHYFLVWEYQARGALHLNLCCGSFDLDLLQRLRVAFKGRWISLLQQIGQFEGIDMFERANGGSWADIPDQVQAYSQFIYQSVVSYLSGYVCSYGQKKDRIAAQGFQESWPCPARWASWSRRLNAERVARTSFSSVDAGLSQVREFLISLSNLLDRCSAYIGLYCDYEGINIHLKDINCMDAMAVRLIAIAAFPPADPACLESARIGNMVRSFFSRSSAPRPVNSS
jgi:hypothetical protein